MKKNKYTLWLILILILIAIGILLKTVFHKDESSIIPDTPNSISEKNMVQDSIKVLNAIKDSIPSNWNTYTDNALGVYFKYPDTWTKYGEENNVINRSGNIAAVEVNFIDSLSNTTLLISYHLSPNGAELYKYAVSQYESSQGWYEKDGKLIEIDGSKAVVAFTEMRVSGRGTALNPPLRLILIDFLDKQQTGAIQLQFKTPFPDEEAEVAKFRLLLSTFKFTN
jgi:hypothetical protein